MIIKLSGDKYVNTERICSISKETRPHVAELRDRHGDLVESITEQVTVYVLAFDSARMTLSQTQGEELLAALPTPYDAASKRKIDAAKNTLRGQLGRERWKSMDDDARYDAITDEVERQEAMATHTNTGAHT